MTTLFDAPGTSPPNPFSTLIAPLNLSSEETNPSPSALASVAAQITHAVTTSTNPATSLWELWDAIFIPTATSRATHIPTLALLSAIRAQPPSLPSNVDWNDDAVRELKSHVDETDGKLHWETLPKFGWSWRDFHDILEANREWKAGWQGASFPTFVEFSALLLQERGEKGEVHPINVFYACSNILKTRETSGDEKKEDQEKDERKLTPEEVRAIDVRVVATWLKFGGRVLWEADQAELRKHFGAALDWERDLWPKKDGLTRERWAFWAERLWGLGEDERFDEQLRTLVKEAAEVIEGLLEGK
ncbi:hypothetical protein B0T16DRAFT_341066 [Cercophora newfieldiana]|uniref:Uncharacterized protein n=1 Tax=Cercophora newfieldiana TaxID=92897 RepID=A0AA40D051_9PEZI|nr:hypothetical protein B0T16DRAFT_341066 [Cercophora newfieldiana]